MISTAGDQNGWRYFELASLRRSALDVRGRSNGRLGISSFFFILIAS
jgi:hypothetical protein